MSSLGLLYVGSTGQPAQQRYEQHLRGERSQWLKRRDIWRLRMELVLGVAPSATRAEGEAEEFVLAERLATLGFDTHCDGVDRAGGAPSGAVLPPDHIAKIGPLLGRLLTAIEKAVSIAPSDKDVLGLLMGDPVCLPEISQRHEARGRFGYLTREQVSGAVAAERRLLQAA